MKITFIRPAMIAGRSHDAMEPLAFGILDALTPAQHQTRLIDERIEPINFDEPTDLVALSFDTYAARRAYQIAAEYRRRGIPVVGGGYHPTLCPDEALGHLDAIAIGDAEDTWPAMLADAERSGLQRMYQSTFPALNGFRIRRDLFHGKQYGPMRLVQAGRGCCHACEFCSIHAFYNHSVRYRPVAAVIDEIRQLRSRYIVFTDDNLFADEAHGRELLEALIPLKVHWSCQAAILLAHQPDILQLMQRSGCLSVTLGLESLNRACLRQMHKARGQDATQYPELIARFHAHGIMVYGSFVMGYDDDGPDCFADTLQFATRLRLFLANFNPITPMPGTRLYSRLQAEGRLSHERWWLAPDFRYGDVVFTPKGMGAAELKNGCYWARTEFNKVSSMLRRGLAPVHRSGAARLATYWIANLVSRREIHRKQGKPLGEPATGNELHPEAAPCACC